MSRETGLYLFHGNCLESLAGVLVEKLQASPAGPLEAETILVQSKGMQKWLSLTLARKLGVCANCVFPFPNTLIQQFFAGLPGDSGESPRFERGVMCFTIYQALPELVREPLFAPLKKYLGDEISSLKAYQLAGRLANLFDQYATYRADLLLDWEAGGEGDWQGELWRRLATAGSGLHRAALHRDFLEAVRQGRLADRKLPGRISVFAVSTLPPFHLDLLSAAARFSSVCFYLLNPCREFWFDLLPAKTRARLSMEHATGGEQLSKSLHYDSGHPLLSSWGMTGKGFFGSLLENDAIQEHGIFIPPPQGSLLNALQDDILSCRRREVGEKTPVSPGDGSLQVHSCHTPMREIEVLQDYLLSCFDSIDGLRASDILVMTPDIEEYAPYITAVFDGVEDDRQRIPYTIADRSPRDFNRLAGSLFELLALRKSRFEASRIMALLESPELQRRFGLQGQDLELICHWLAETRIRWGLSATDRADLGLPPFRENSWQAGLERLLLGYALPGDDKTLYQGILPYPDVEGSGAAVLGNLLDFVHSLSAALRFMKGERTLEEWIAWLRALLGDFFLVNGDAEEELLAVEKALEELSRAARLANCDRLMDIEAVEAALGEKLNADTGTAGHFLSGRVTFCALLPMRSIPFRVIALVGLNDGRFPRKNTALGFDLMARFPRPGDRSLREEDKYLFLETLISARDRLFISYLGQNIRDNSEIQPSGVVSEVLAYLEANYRVGDGPDSLAGLIHIRHPLQSFDPRYFQKGGRFFSYSRENFEALQAALTTKREEPVAIHPLPLPEGRWEDIQLSQLLTFFHHPLRFFYRRRLGIFLEEKSAIPEDRENFDLAGLDKYRLGSSLTLALLKGESPEEIYPAVREQGILPPGAGGRIAYQRLAEEAGSLAARIREVAGTEEERTLDVEGKVGNFRLSGQVGGVFGTTLVRFRFARLKGVDYLKIWLELLALQAFRGSPELRGFLVGGDGVWECRGHAEPEGALCQLLALFGQGLCRPLMFFPETSLAYFHSMQRLPDQPDKALAAARQSWEGDNYRRGEATDPYYTLCFGGQDALLSQEFAALAEEVYGPLFRERRGA